MIRGRCPTCGKGFEIAGLADLPSFPFCTPRCKLIDLGRWIDGTNAIPGDPEPVTDEAESGDEES